MLPSTTRVKVVLIQLLPLSRHLPHEEIILYLDDESISELPDPE